MFRSLSLLLIACFALTFAHAQDAPAPAPAGDEFKSLDQDVQALKKEVLDLNRELFVLEEELLFPANTQVAVFISMDVGEFFALDSVTLKLDNKEVANYLYTEREAQALLKGGVHRVYIGNLKAGASSSRASFRRSARVSSSYCRGVRKPVASDRACSAAKPRAISRWRMRRRC